MVIAATQSKSGLIYGIALIVLGFIHFVFREFYARRTHAYHDARQATAPDVTRRFYRNHSDGWYLRSQYWVSAIMVGLGIVELALNS
ncbi:MAG TPA: hypothetical protein VHU61_14575 [Solirubrobacteraceae bacterium]|jgi:hypothetical protein|nr:hypothetical protein [Solirubrobacteraceae bacterium]